MTRGRSQLRFTSEEQEILSHVLPAEEFRYTAWDTYGPDWTEHIPQAINLAMWYWFGGARLYPWHLAVYYCPVPNFTGMGGRGSAKTVGLSMANSLYTALHPGEPHLHVSPVKDQALRSYEAVIEWGSRASGRPSFNERFIKEAVVAPFPEIRFNSWHDADPGNVMRFRPLGDDDIERLRSLEAGTISVDEAFRTVEHPRTYAQLRGCIRGINQVKLALLPLNIRTEIEDLGYQVAMAPMGRSRTKLQAEYDHICAFHRLNRRNMLQLYGNAGPFDWSWELYDRGDDDPKHYFSLTVTSYDNPALGQENIAEMKRAYGDDVETMEQEMNAQRPGGQGDWFVTKTIARCIDEDLLPEMEEAVANNRPGWLLKKHFSYGVYLYQKPPDKQHHYVLGADPGSGAAPGRNKWAIMVYDITLRPAELVYFEMGNVLKKDVGDFNPFWKRVKEVVNTYPMGLNDAWVESSGNQKGMEQLAFPEDVRVVPVSLAATKPILLNQHRTLMAQGLLKWPLIMRLKLEHGNYTLPDTKLVQDLVMTAMCASGAVWRYIDRNYLAKASVDLNGNVEIKVGNGRYDRPLASQFSRRDLTPFVERSTFDL